LEDNAFSCRPTEMRLLWIGKEANQMIWRDTFFTFVDLNQSQPTSVSEFNRIVTSKRNRVLAAVKVEYQEENETYLTFCLILKPLFESPNLNGTTNAVVYYIGAKGAETSSFNEQIMKTLTQTQVKLVEALPDPPRTSREKLLTPWVGTLNKNQWHQFLERKIKELREQL
jgi:hypothetical protein